MYIKTIVLDGFKSYGQRTEVTGFDNLFTAITGLNGTGKSNILDAICFVLGISNLTHVRAGSLQDLIYKQGQAGINKATVCIIFDNTNLVHSPPGFEDIAEITITRQLILGGKNRYMINGTNVTHKKVQDLFCSIQLNVNNPHFLIMQGKITKVLNMKAREILGMIEEAAGTRIYESKRQIAEKSLELKNTKLNEVVDIFTQELNPKLEKRHAERAQYLEFQRIERELLHMLGIYQAWQYFVSQTSVLQANAALVNEMEQIKEIQHAIVDNENMIKRLDEEVYDFTNKSAKSDESNELEKIQTELKEQQKKVATVTASLKSKQDDISLEERNKKQLEKNLSDDRKTLASKQTESKKTNALFEQLKEDDARDNDMLLKSQRIYEALSAGMEVNEDGESETLQEQLMKYNQEATRIDIETKQTAMRLKTSEAQLVAQQNEMTTNSAEYETNRLNLTRIEADVKLLQNNLQHIDYSNERMNELETHKTKLSHEINDLQQIIADFKMQKPFTQFRYRDPEIGFDRRSVHGVVCQLIQVKRPDTYAAIEAAGGGKLYSVVVDTDVTCSKLLKNGNLQQRTTFIPLNKIVSHPIDKATAKFAQDLVGKENVDTAISLIDYNRDDQAAMEFVFGDAFICRDKYVAEKVAFHKRIKRVCITLDGDVYNPFGTLSGGALKKGESIFIQLRKMQQNDERLNMLEQQLNQQINVEINTMNAQREQYQRHSDKLMNKQHEMNLMKQRLEQTTYQRQLQEIDNLKNEIDHLREKIVTLRNLGVEMKGKIKEIEVNLQKYQGNSGSDQKLKEAEAQMQLLTVKAAKSRTQWKQYEVVYETLNMEINELQNGLEQQQEQIKLSDQAVLQLKEQYEEMNGDLEQLKAVVNDLQKEIEKGMSQMAAKNNEIQLKLRRKEEIVGEVNELKLEIKKRSHEVKRLEDNYKKSKVKESDYEKKIKKDDRYLNEAKALNDAEGQNLEKRIRSMQERKVKLGRTVNAQAQALYESEDKEYQVLNKRKTIIKHDKEKILEAITDLDKKKHETLKLAYQQISKDFGSIFSTLLPGSNARLVPMFGGKGLVDGLEVKIFLGGVWKESLTELSGGQRSLAALSLILAMLLFKPAPIYILDEIDAALDLSHTQNIGAMLKTHFKQSQFIIVSLKDGMFSNANVLFRTKFIDGVSTVMRSVNKINS